jgi:hypothetical protein
MRITPLACGLLMVFAPTACASHFAIGPERFTEVDQAIRAAEQAGASDVDRAAANHLGLARSQAIAARKLNQDGDGHRASSMLQRARADAELARAMALEHVAHDRAEQSRKDLRDARADLERSKSPP